MLFVTLCVSVCSILLLAWIVLEVAPRAGQALVDRVCGACFAALAVTSVVVFAHLVTSPASSRGPIPFFVFFGAPIGLYLAWLSFRLAGGRAKG